MKNLKYGINETEQVKAIPEREEEVEEKRKQSYLRTCSKSSEETRFNEGMVKSYDLTLISSTC